MRILALMVVTVLASCSAPAGMDGGTGGSGGSGGSSGGLCANVGCSGQGQCMVQNGAATCQCNAGFTANGLTCVQAAQCDGKANGTACSDGNPCTTGDSCMNNQCVSGAGCAAAAECSSIVCDMAVGCVSTAAQDGTTCSVGLCFDAGCVDTDVARWPVRDRMPADYEGTGGFTLDKVTGLLWERDFNLTYRTAAEAQTACANLTMADGGWRLPSRIELLSVVDFNHVKPSLNATYFPFPSGPSTCMTSADCNTGLDTAKGSFYGCEGGACILLGGPFWTSTASDAGTYVVNFTRGEVQTQQPTEFARTRCVKYGRPPVVKPARYTAINADQVKDEYTGITWETQPQAANFRGDVNLACMNNVGYRLPTIAELHTLVSIRQSPYRIDPRFNINAVTGPRYWADQLGGLTPLPGGNNWAVQFDTATGGFHGPTLQSTGRCMKPAP